MSKRPAGPRPQRGRTTAHADAFVRAHHRPVGDLAIGIDIGGTKVAAALVDRDGRRLRGATEPTPRPPTADAVIATVSTLLSREIVRGSSMGRLVGVGIGTAGVVDPPTGAIRSATETLIAWEGLDLAETIGDMCDLPVRVDNDVNAMGLAEARIGAARGHGRCLMVAIGTGIGGAFVREGQVDRGATGTAWEIGHLPVGPPEGPRCPCGRGGHLEAYASGPALLRAYLAIAGNDAADDLQGVARMAKAGQTAAIEVLGQGATTLGRALGGLTNILDPDIVVVGGGVLSVGIAFMRPLRESFRVELLPGPSRVPLRRARLGAQAGVVGAGLLAFDDPTLGALADHRGRAM
jgi:glucokinase